MCSDMENKYDNIAVVGVQWGDEGKGKIVDALAEHFDIVARYQGGANAGHTVYANGKKFILQLIPTGILRSDKTAVIGQGVVVNPESLLEEIEAIENNGISVGRRLFVSDRAHLIMPYHRSHEVAAEEARGVGRIGTTAKGIGPTYEDKAGRRGLRTCDLRNPELFVKKCKEVLAEKDRIGEALFGGQRFRGDQWVTQYYETAQRIVPYLTDASAYLHAEMERGKRVLFEGAQGTLLDVDHGTYPYVTSSSAAAGGASTGTGVGPTRIGAVMGVSKAYATRVGSGPFPTEEHGAAGEKLRDRGGEYGSVTGRPRRCGWFDVLAARYAARVNDLAALVITKLDILDSLEEIPVGVEYEYEGRRMKDYPAETEVLEKVQVRYRTMPGWRESTLGRREFAELPSRAKDYLRLIADEVGIEIAMVSTGPERGQAIWLEDSRLIRRMAPTRR
jgi:adenylosuccinate synthase